MHEANWSHVVRVAHALEDSARCASPAVAHEHALRALQTLDEIFPRTLDPVTDFEAYALRQLAKALLAALTVERRAG